MVCIYIYRKSKFYSFEVFTLERYLDTIQYACGDSFEALANSEAAIEKAEQNDLTSMMM